MGQRYFEPRANKVAETEGRDSFYVVSHDVLFTPPPGEVGAIEDQHCHACKTDLDEEDDETFAVNGRGLLLFSRGEERRAEEPRLCSSCGAAVGMAMLTRSQIEEEEG